MRANTVRSPLGRDFWLSVYQPANRKYAPMVLEVGSDLDISMRRCANQAEKIALFLEEHGWVRGEDIVSVGSVLIGMTERLADAVSDWLYRGADLRRKP
jgi:hypothetical protein